MTRVQSFAPVETADACILILGTMPGAESLRQKRYYAHPQNQFWKIAGSLFNFDAKDSYTNRITALKQARVALWDVLKSCTRATSLDSDIDETSAYPNDFEAFFANHPNVRMVCFNGAAAENLFRKFVPLSQTNLKKLRFMRLPSSSPANARLTFENKKNAWRAILRDGPLNGTTVAD